MAIRHGISKSDYAEMYDKQARRLFYFALRLTGDELLARRAMAELFTEGYRCCRFDNFLIEMVELLWRILESEHLSGNNFDGCVIPPLDEISFLARAAVLMRIIFSIAESEIAEILSLSAAELENMLSELRVNTADAV